MRRQFGVRTPAGTRRFIGTISKELLGLGTKSERMGYVVETAGKKLTLEADGFGSFAIEAFAPFAGHRCRIEASQEGARLLAREVQALDKPGLNWSLTYTPGRTCTFCGQPVGDQAADHCPRCGAAI